MEKVYKQGAKAKGLGLVGIAVGVWGLIDSVVNKNFVNLLWMSVGIVVLYRVVFLGFFGVRIYVTDQHIRVDYPKGFRPSKELNWSEIHRVADYNGPINSDRKSGRAKIHWSLGGDTRLTSRAR